MVPPPTPPEAPGPQTLFVLHRCLSNTQNVGRRENGRPGAALLPIVANTGVKAMPRARLRRKQRSKRCWIIRGNSHFTPTDLIYSPFGFHLIQIVAAINTQKLIKRHRSCWVEQQALLFTPLERHWRIIHRFIIVHRRELCDSNKRKQLKSNHVETSDV